MKNTDYPIDVFVSDMYAKRSIIIEDINPEVVQKQLDHLEAEIIAGMKSNMNVGKLNRLRREAAQLNNLLKMKTESVLAEAKRGQSRRSGGRNNDAALFHLAVAGIKKLHSMYKGHQEAKKPKDTSIGLWHHPGDNHFYGHIHGKSVNPLTEKKLRAHLINDHGYHPQDAEHVIHHVKKHQAIKVEGTKGPSRKEKMVEHLRHAIAYHNAEQKVKSHHETIKTKEGLVNKRHHLKTLVNHHIEQAKKHGYKHEKHSHIIDHIEKEGMSDAERDEQAQQQWSDSHHKKMQAAKERERHEKAAKDKRTPPSKDNGHRRAPSPGPKKPQVEPETVWPGVRRYDPDSKHAAQKKAEPEKKTIRARSQIRKLQKK